MNSRYRAAWAALILAATIVVPMRLVEISQAHADRDAAKARIASSSTVRG